MEPLRSNKTLRTVVLPIAISIALYWITSSTFLSVIVLLLASHKVETVNKGLLSVLIVILFVIAYHFIQLRDLLNKGEGFGLFIIGLYLPISTLIASGVWIATEKKRMLYRLLYASLFAFVSGFLIVVWLSGNSESALYTKDVYQDLITSLVSLVMINQMPVNDMNEVANIVTSMITNVGLMFFIAQFGVAVFISEMITKRFNSEFQERMLKWRIPHEAIWFLLAGMSAILLSFLVDSVLLESLAYNVSTVIALLYTVQGISIATNFLVKKVPHIRPSRIFFLSGALLILPGANVVFILGFPLLGISETWITYRQNE
jgi:hypothetical protein